MHVVLVNLGDEILFGCVPSRIFGRLGLQPRLEVGYPIIDPSEPLGQQVLEREHGVIVPGLLLWVSAAQLVTFLMPREGVDTSSLAAFKLILAGPELLVEDL